MPHCSQTSSGSESDHGISLCNSVNSESSIVVKFKLCDVSEEVETAADLNKTLGEKDSFADYDEQLSISASEINETLAQSKRLDKPAMCDASTNTDPLSDSPKKSNPKRMQRFKPFIHKTYCTHSTNRSNKFYHHNQRHFRPFNQVAERRREYYFLRSLLYGQFSFFSEMLDYAYYNA
ncbi:uncharacterized protein LOC106647816 [Copidosoma floridanum]|uniref:uncharacterized protein LOC106647816 n=1 Tax=Copidosoma floridanum TaxID=29053 RepID=UPI0006C98430|nr:uncharacterized protein LOC106647816 [Copidosoma floridanum]